MRPPAKCRASRNAFWKYDEAEDFEEAVEVAEEMLLVGIELGEDKSVLAEVDADDSSLGETAVSTESSGRAGKGGLGSSA
jgi:hypothetical protein